MIKTAKHTQERRHTTRHTFRKVLKHMVLFIAGGVTVFPFLWMVFASFKSESNVFSKDFSLLPQTWVFDNYAKAFMAAPFALFFKNSLIVAAISICFQVVTCAFAAYGFARLEFPCKKILFTLLLSATMLPSEAAIVPNFLLVTKLGLKNTMFGIAIPTLCSVFGIFLLRQLFLGIPDDLFHAAKLDGCGEIRAFFCIGLPNVAGGIATVALLAFLDSWNAYMWPYMITDLTTKRTLQIGLKYLIKPDLGPEWPTIMAASTSIVIPILIVFVFLNKYFVAGIAKTGIK